MATKIDMTNLEDRLKTLSGLDFEACEREERAAGNTQPLVQFTSGFAVRLAARALGVNHNVLKALPINEYTQITGRTTNFLFSDSEPTGEESNTQESQSEN